MDEFNRQAWEDNTEEGMDPLDEGFNRRKKSELDGWGDIEDEATDRYDI